MALPTDNRKDPPSLTDLAQRSYDLDSALTSSEWRDNYIRPYHTEDRNLVWTPIPPDPPLPSTPRDAILELGLKAASSDQMPTSRAQQITVMILDAFKDTPAHIRFYAIQALVELATNAVRFTDQTPPGPSKRNQDITLTQATARIVWLHRCLDDAYFLTKDPDTPPLWTTVE